MSISSSQTSPSINTYVNLTAETDRDYRGWVTFEMQYRASSSNSWQNVSSSSYFVASNAFTNGYQFTSYDDGYRTFGSFVSFMKAGQFRVVAKDDSGRTAYAQFFVEEDSTTNSFLSLSASTTSPSLNTYVDVTVETDSTYRGGVDFSLEYRSSSSSSWKTISSSSSDISASTYLRNGYQFTSSDRGYKKFYDFLKFYEAGEYRLTAEDDTGRERSLTFYVKESRSTVNDYIRITTNRSYPDVDQYVNITLETSSDYRGRVDFEVQYRSTSSSSWSKLGTSSSSYFTADSYLRKGYQFTSSDRGYRSFSNFIRFAKSGSYRLYVKDSAGNQDYVQFDIQSTDSSSSVNGFTNAELRKVTNLSKIWNSVIDQLKNKSYSLRTDSYWQRLSDSLYTNMRDVVSGNYYRVFKDYSDFLSAFNEWYTYTVRNR
ncbi:hypothetical protein J5893_03880 [bacterium]|nr:hypothetical protein [bacterium]